MTEPECDKTNNGKPSNLNKQKKGAAAMTRAMSAKNGSTQDLTQTKGRIMTAAERNQMATETIAMFDRLLGFYSNLNQDNEFNTRNTKYIDDVLEVRTRP